MKKNSKKKVDEKTKLDDYGCFTGETVFRISLDKINSHLFAEQFDELNSATFGTFREFQEKIKPPSEDDEEEITKEYEYVVNTKYEHLLFLGSSMGALCVLDWTVSFPPNFPIFNFLDAGNCVLRSNTYRRNRTNQIL